MSGAHWASTNDDTAKIYSLTDHWHDRSPDRWLHVASDIGTLARAICRRHAEAIRAVAEVLALETRIDGARFLEIAREHLAAEACEQSRADVEALAGRMDRNATAGKEN
jgi:hypothetical protein